jgi:hypothetical protein
MLVGLSLETMVWNIGLGELIEAFNLGLCLLIRSFHQDIDAHIPTRAREKDNVFIKDIGET